MYYYTVYFSIYKMNTSFPMYVYNQLLVLAYNIPYARQYCKIKKKDYRAKHYNVNRLKTENKYFLPKSINITIFFNIYQTDCQKSYIHDNLRQSPTKPPIERKLNTDFREIKYKERTLFLMKRKDTV